MTEEEKRSWDVWIAIATGVVTVVTIFVGLYQFNKGEENKVRLENELLQQKDDIAFRRQLWSERVSTYRKIAEAVGALIATIDNKDDLSKKVTDFSALYWGTMIFVEDKDVERAMVDFATTVRDFQNGWVPVEKVKFKADALIQVCRNSAATGAPAAAQQANVGPTVPTALTPVSARRRFRAGNP
jgi:hypothetical protein